MSVWCKWYNAKVFKKILEDRRAGLFFILAALLSLLVLAGALRTVDFKPAERIGAEESNSQSLDLSPIATILQDAAKIPLWRQVLFWVGILITAFFITSLLSPELRKKILLAIFRAGVTTMIILYVVKSNPNVLGPLFLSLDALNTEGVSITPSELPPPVFEPPQVPSYLSFLVTFAVVIAAGLAGWGLFRLWTKFSESEPHPQPLRDLGEIARKSLHDLESGQDARDAIVACYEQMNQVVAAKRGFNREYYMTAAEFETQLERFGLPRAPLARLTRLFESVRYGGHGSGPQEMLEAADCLKAIVQACGVAE